MHSWSPLPTLSPSSRPAGTHIPLHPFCVWYPRVRPHGLGTAIWRQRRWSDWSQDQAGLYASSWNYMAVEKTASKVQLFQCEGANMLYWPASQVAYKRNSWRAWILVCSQWWTPPHPSWPQPELHHLDTVCWISRFPVNVTLLWGTPTPIYQATWDTPTPIINLSSTLVPTLSNLSSKLGSAHSNLSNYLGRVQSNNLECALSLSVKQLGVRPLQSIKHLGARPF